MRRKNNALLLSILFSATLQAQLFEQLGPTLEEVIADEYFGRSVDIAEFGERIIIGAPGNSTSSLEGTARVYDYDFGSNSWNLVGDEITGDAIDDQFGFAVGITENGDRIAVGAPNNSNAGNQFGQVRVYDLISGSWVNASNELNGTNIGDDFGYALAFNTAGDRLAIGAPQGIISGQRRGYVEIYEYDGSTWNLMGSRIPGATMRDGMGFSVKLNENGDRVAIGAALSGSGSTLRGYAAVYEFNGNSWIQLGSDIEGTIEQLGTAIAIDGDGDRIAIGGPNNDSQGSNAGSVMFKQFDGSDWVDLGSRLYGHTSDEFFGTSLDMDVDGVRVLVGSLLYFNPDTSTQTGAGSVFTWDGASWLPADKGPIAGESEFEFFGWSVALDRNGQSMIIGSSELARVYSEVILDINTVVETKMELLPNPVVEGLRLKLSDPLEIQKITIFNYLGQRVYERLVQERIADFRMNLGNLQSGTYIIQIKSDKGTFRRKIIKQ